MLLLPPLRLTMSLGFGEKETENNEISERTAGLPEERFASERGHCFSPLHQSMAVMWEYVF